MSGVDRQWQLNRRNFEGCWQGASAWYLREGEGQAGLLRFEQPSRVIDPTRYAISFNEDDTEFWDGSGLLFAPGGTRQLQLTRDTYIEGNFRWQFAGVGGQASLQVNAEASRFGQEINLFHARSRSMLVLLWALDPDGWHLSSVGAVPFRCQLSSPLDPARPPLDAAELLALVEGWPGSEESLEPGQWPDQDPEPTPTAPFSRSDFIAGDCTMALADRLVFSVPERLPGGAFRLEVGCLLTPERFHQISLLFNPEQRLERIRLRRFRMDQG